MAVAFEQRRIGLIIEVDGITGIVETWERRRLISSRGKGSDLEVGAVVFAVGWPGNAHNVNLIAAGVEIGVGGYVRLDDTLRTSPPKRRRSRPRTRFSTEIGPYGPRSCPMASLPTPNTVASASPRRKPGASRTAPSPWCPTRTSTGAFIDGPPGGSCKLIVPRATRCDPGAHIVGEQAREVVQLAATAMRAGMRVEQLADLEFTYPTFTAVVGMIARRIARSMGVAHLAS
jgi:Pyridine nucleotide-disulphide oxidoreductase, dimerisation domain